MTSIRAIAAILIANPNEPTAQVPILSITWY
jgi:hypothetical protein